MVCYRTIDSAFDHGCGEEPCPSPLSCLRIRHLHALDRIANAGLRYTQFHSTALCSPTRAALITGRNHHAVGFGMVSEAATGFPGYNSIIARSLPGTRRPSAGS
jgi:arylsulfatase A-like enzyme